MKQKIVLYLFVFAVLLVIFQYVNSKNVFESYEKKLDEANEHIETYKDSIASLENEILDLRYFNLEYNDDALSYFERDGYDTKTLIPFIKDEVYKLNETKGEHPLIPYASMTDRKMMINKVRLLNHKWILADFSDGKHWGELFITYEIIDKAHLKFNLVESFLYPLQED
jgi:hypothetical protein